MSNFNLPEEKKPVVNEGSDAKSGENGSPQAITGAVEAGWGGSVAGTNAALGPDDATDEPTEEIQEEIQ